MGIEIMSPREVGKELERMNEEYAMRKAREMDRQEQLDRVESKLNDIMDFLKNTQPK